MADSRPVLWHLSISPYSEKVRWALDHKGVEHERRSSPPGSHMMVALALTRGRHHTFPVMRIDGRNVGDSTAIIAALEEHYPDPPLYPDDPDERRRALGLEDFFDEELVPHLRLLVFHEMVQDRERFNELAAATPGPLQRWPRAAGAYGRAFVALRYGVRSAKKAELARTKVVAALDRLEAELNGNEYLVGDRFTVADLALAALASPAVAPEQFPYAQPQRGHPRLDQLREALDQAGIVAFSRRMYALHRGA